MKYFLLLIIVSLLGGGYFEYSILQKNIDDKDAQIRELNDKSKALNASIAKLEGEKKALTKNIEDAKSQISDLNLQNATLNSKNGDLTTQLTTTSKALADAKKTIADRIALDAATGGKLGTIVTQDGKTFQDCVLLAVVGDGIVFNHTAGITKVLFPFLPPNLQKRFGYDAQKMKPQAPVTEQ